MTRTANGPFPTFNFWNDNSVEPIDPGEDQVNAFVMGRFQPFGHQHFLVNDYMAEHLGVDRLDVFVDDTHEERLPKSPMLGENLVPAVREAYEEEYKTDYEVRVLGRDVLSGSFYRDFVRRGVEGYSFMTREESHRDEVGKFEGLEDVTRFGFDIPVFGPFGFSVEYWPRDNEPFQDADYDFMESSTRIRQHILEGDPDWRGAVSNPVEDAVDQNYCQIMGPWSKIIRGEGSTRMRLFQTGVPGVNWCIFTMC